MAQDTIALQEAQIRQLRSRQDEDRMTMAGLRRGQQWPGQDQGGRGRGI